MNENKRERKDHRCERIAGMLVFIGSVIAIFMIGFIFGGCVNSIINADENKSQWNVEQLDNWCGQPAGQIRMVGAVYYDGEFEDEQGNLWGYGAGLEEDGFYLLWIDDMGTDFVQDDEIIKVWQEK